MKVKYKIIELEHFKKKLGIFTVRKEETVGGVIVSSKVFESDNKKECLDFIKKLKK